jgi:ABC-type transport system involved in multi-copper enzyme maturation permease subunit
MNLQALNKICFTICIVCIVLSTLLTFYLIWGSANNETIWRLLLSLFIVFLAAVLTLSVSRAFGDRW